MKVKKIKVRLGQVWKQKNHNIYLLIAGKRTDNRWLAKTLTKKHNVFGTTHAISEYILWKCYEQVE